MLSVCIPIYNVDVSELTTALHQQLMREDTDFEILLADDASLENYQEKNRSIVLPHVRYIASDTNRGRSRIRNLLAQEAKYPFLLFLDCDSKVPSDSYISRYLRCCVPEAVVYGGRSYETTRPESPYYLRWKYGVERESVTATQRSEKPNYNFATNNFLIDKSVFDTVCFDESIEGYGHEDTFFGLELLARGITVNHIDNPLIHIGLETADEFLRKTEQGVCNLRQIDRVIQAEYPSLSKHSRLMNTARKIKRLHLRKVASALFRLTREPMRRNLLGKRPSLVIFDLYKLGILCSLSD